MGFVMPWLSNAAPSSQIALDLVCLQLCLLLRAYYSITGFRQGDHPSPIQERSYGQRPCLHEQS
jgi:hypothetical protein